MIEVPEQKLTEMHSSRVNASTEAPPRESSFVERISLLRPMSMGSEGTVEDGDDAYERLGGPWGNEGVAPDA